MIFNVESWKAYIAFLHSIHYLSANLLTVNYHKGINSVGACESSIFEFYVLFHSQVILEQTFTIATCGTYTGESL